MVGGIESLFPLLQSSLFQVTSPATRDYNCVAWAVADMARWWWPDPVSAAAFWPPDAPLQETIEAFIQAVATLGYLPCSSEELEAGSEKVAVFARDGIPNHVSRQLSDGRWTSKLGQREDIVHELHALSGEIYGSVVQVLRRPNS